MTLQNLDRTAEPSSMDVGAALARVRFAVLWVIVGCALAGTMAVFFYEPGVLEEGVAGVMEGETVTEGMALLNAAMVALPLAIAAAVLFLPGRATAIGNLAVGVPLGVFGLYALVSEVSGGALHAHVTLAALATVIAWLIVGLSIAELRHRPHGAAPAAGADARAGA